MPITMLQSYSKIPQGWLQLSRNITPARRKQTQPNLKINQSKSNLNKAKITQSEYLVLGWLIFISENFLCFLFLPRYLCLIIFSLLRPLQHKTPDFSHVPNCRKEFLGVYSSCCISVFLHTYLWMKKPSFPEILLRKDSCGPNLSYVAWNFLLK